MKNTPIKLATAITILTGALLSSTTNSHSLHAYIPGGTVQPIVVADVDIFDNKARRFKRGGDLGFVGHTPNGPYLTMGDVPVNGKKYEVALFKIINAETGNMPFVRGFSGKIAGNMQWHPRISTLLGVVTKKGSTAEGMQNGALVDMLTGYRAKWVFDSFTGTGKSRQWGMLDDIDADAIYAIGHDMGSGANTFSSTKGRAFVLRCSFARDPFVKANWEVVWQSGAARVNSNLYGSRGGRRLYVGVQRLPGHENMVAVVNDWNTKTRHVQVANGLYNDWSKGFKTINKPTRADNLQRRYRLPRSINYGEMTGTFVYNRKKYYYLSTGWPGNWDALYISLAKFNN